jgi:hypothetical protein
MPNRHHPQRSTPKRRIRVRSIVVVFAMAIAAAFTARMWAQTAQIAASNLRESFDIRVHKEQAPDGYLEQFARPAASGADALTANLGAGLARLQADFGRADLKRSPELDTIEIVRAKPGSPFLTAPSENRVAALRGFLSGYADAFGLSAQGIQNLEVVADYQNPSGGMAWVELEQRINGLPVFRGSIRGGFTSKGELAGTTGQLAPGLEQAALTVNPGLTAQEAISRAAAHVGWKVSAGALQQKAVADDGKITFARGPMADDARAWLLYFPLAPGVARLAWATEIWGNPDVYLVVLDADDGTVLFRKYLTDFQTQNVIYAVYNDDSPAPSSPIPTGTTPGSHFQAPSITRSTFNLIGNEGPLFFNNFGWMKDGTNLTDGNNVEAGIDRDGINGVDVPVMATLVRFYDFPYNPSTQNPLDVSYQRGEVTNVFYWTNRFHDLTYMLGFNEAARNFQHDNFGRGGLGGDRISAEAQDSSGTNNANFATPTDGGRGRMQMYIFPNPTPDRSGGLDRDVIIHELTHGLSNRLHANATGLSTLMARGMGEGWSDFYARALMATSNENVNGIYTIGGWLTHSLVAGFEDNYYYGIRRFPYAVKTTVGPNGKPHNPLTLADIDSTQINLSDGAFAPSPVGAGSNANSEHNIGEVWAMALFEVRARLINRLGFGTGNQRALQFVTDGMKLNPAAPDMLQARDSIIDAAFASGASSGEIGDIWAGFAARGMGVLAEIDDTDAARVVENFNVPGDPLPTFNITSGAAITEGNSGTTMATFTVGLSNPNGGTSRVFYFTEDDTAEGDAHYQNVTPITIPGSGSATPYPSTVTVSGRSGTIRGAALVLYGVEHTFPADLDVLLVGPGGQKVMLLSDAGGSSNASAEFLAFVDGAPAASSSRLRPGIYSPTDLSPGETLPAPAPAGPYGTSLSVFDGTDPNGTWSVYVFDDMAGDAGSIEGFELIIATSDMDYRITAGELVFPPGTTSQTVSVPVNGDTLVEPNEHFGFFLSDDDDVNLARNAVVGNGFGTGTIFNDDGNSPATMASPPPGSVLNSTTTTFLWTPGSGVSQYWLYVGTTPGGFQIYNASTGTNRAATVTGLPRLGGPVYVRLWSLIGATWSFNDYTYTAVDHRSRLILPAAGGTLPGPTALFRWTTGSGVTDRWLYIGTSPGATNIYNAQQGSGTERLISGLPTTGVPLYARLWSLIGGSWTFLDYSFRAADLTLARLTSPANGSMFGGSSATLNWTIPGGVTQVWLYVGTSVGATNIVNANKGTATSHSFGGLPTNGSNVYARLWSLQGGSWKWIDYHFFATGGSRANLTLPAVGGTLPGATATFRWSAGTGVTTKWLYIGTAQGAANIYNAEQFALTERTITGLPTTGVTLHARLWSLIAGVWQFNDYSFRAADPSLASLTSPANGSKLPGSSATFTWVKPISTGVTWLYIGTGVGQSNILNVDTGGSLSHTATGLPTSGGNLFLRLWSFHLPSGTWKWVDYHFTAGGAAFRELSAAESAAAAAR